MILNQQQSRILNMPNIQELIKALDLDIHDSGKDTRRLISNRVSAWIDHADVQTHQKRIISRDEPLMSPFASKDAWIKDMISIHGQNWCPF